MAKDSQRGKVYKAERQAFQEHGLISWDEVLKLVKRIESSQYVKNKYPRLRPVDVRQRRGGGANATMAIPKVWYGEIISVERGRFVQIGKYDQRDWVVVHEIAHHVVGLYAGHDWRFCAAYLDLVRHFLGRDAHDRLKSAFKANKVKFTKPRPKREVSPERRAELVERLAVARAAKAAKSPTLDTVGDLGDR